MTAQPFKTGAVARHLITRLAIVGIVLSLAVSSLQLANDYRQAVSQLVEALDRIETTYLPSVVENAWLDDRDRIGTLLDGIVRLPAFAHAAVRGSDGAILVERGAPAQTPLTRSFALTRPYGDKNVDLGSLTLTADLGVLRDQALHHLVSAVAGNAVLLAALAVLLYLLVHRTVTARLELIAAQAERLGRLGPSQAPPLDLGPAPQPDELTALGQSLNRMQGQLADAISSVAVNEERYRELFARSPVSLWEEDFSAVRQAIEAVSHDITDISTYLDQHPQFVRDCAAKVRIIAVNDATVTMHRASDAADLCDRLPTIFTPASFDAFRQQLVAIWLGEGDVTATSEVRTLEGDIRDIVIRWHVPPAHRDRYDRVIVSQEDITDIKVAQRSAEITMEKLMQAKAELERFTFVASHDLREPIRSIISFSQLLERTMALTGPLPPDVAEYLAYLKAAASRMQDQVTGLYDYARAGQPKEAFQPVALNEPLADAQQALKEVIEQTGTIIRSAPLPLVSGHRQQLAEMFRHLLDNSIKFRRPGVPPEISVDSCPAGDFVRVTISDNGIGIDPLYVAGIFDVFRRLHGPGEYPGAGLGLSICRRIVETHGGHISADPTRTVGTAIVVLLPAANSAS
ncbi:Signal transduction histidine kinase [Magnetospirillum sp. LM-5]|uniref:ATP-binding protein n=1 Tax=Magnetospirillum sp. LM-5 TaxID=2681466 RepID=UPI00137D0286|nr:ATP-binding protein [Magnetospirillum sp. LM-5]CAA7611601.1 Signal transduction histidine kinase [Magnetospirillum sp. LM-5]